MTKHTYPRFSAREKNKNLMKILIATESFQDEVKSVRGLFKIPEKGLQKETEYKDWLSSVCRNMELDRHGRTRIHIYVIILNEIAKDYNLPENFVWHMREYIETGNISYPLNNFDVTPSSSRFQSPSSHTYTKLSQKEKKDLLDELARFEEPLPSIMNTKHADRMLKSEMMYKERDEVNIADEDYDLTLKEMVSIERMNVDKVYEDKRMLDDYRKKQFGKI